MSKKNKPHRSAGPSLEELKQRAERAKREGRFQQALDLVKQVYKEQPTPAHLELLKETYLGRARQLRDQKQTRAAAPGLVAASRLDENNFAWLEKLAGEVIQCGEAQRAQALLDRVPEAARSGQVTVALADAAVTSEGASRNALPAALHADLDRVLLAFRQVEQGQDEPARETLQAIGLKSPFLEWKLLLRGLQAYYQNDDARALENWQRLSGERTPARLAAPFLAQIHAPYREAQSPAAQTSLRQQFERLQSSALLPQLRNLRTQMVSQGSLAQAFRLMETMAPAVRAEAPHLMPRLASAFYWAIIESGPDDLLRYQRVFGPPPHDPHLYRLQALAYDRHDDLTGAHEYWKRYEKEIAAHPDLWPSGQAEHARALIWQHLGDNALGVPSEHQLAKLPKQLRDVQGLAPKLDPGPEKCYQHAIELAPDLLEAHAALVDHLFKEGLNAKAEKAARQLLERFPDHIDTLEQLSNHLLANHPAEALELAERALQHNPLDRARRQQTATAHVALAQAHALAGRFEEARQQFRAALAFEGDMPAPLVLAPWAACELKAGDAPRAEELIVQLRASTRSEALVAYALRAEVTLLKLPAPIKKRFDAEVTAALKAPPTGRGASGLALVLLKHHLAGLTYYGQKTHVKKALAWIEKAHTVPLDVVELRAICEALFELSETPRTIDRFLRRGRKDFPTDPFFPYHEAVRALDTKGSRSMGPYRARPLLLEVQRLCRARPGNEEAEWMLEDVERRLELLDAFNPFGGGIFDTILDSFRDGFPGGFPFGAPEDDDDDDGWG